MEEVFDVIVQVGGGLVLGVLLEKWNERRTCFTGVMAKLMAALEDSKIRENGYLRLAALQRAGGALLSSRQLKRLESEIMAHGHPSIYAAWIGLFPEFKDFPREFLLWAKKSRLDLGDPEVALSAMNRVFGARNYPKPPEPLLPSVISLGCW